MTDVRPLLPYELSNGPREPGDLHTECCTEEPKAEGADCGPSEWEQLWLAPGIKIISAPPSASEDNMLLRNDNNVYDRPVSDDA